MLVITLPSVEVFDEASETFHNLPEVVLHLEHSLASLSKWESVYEKTFLGKEEKTTEQIHNYIRFMNDDEDLGDEVFARLSAEDYNRINQYITAKRSAVWFPEDTGEGSAPSREAVTSELIYYWMVSHNIPFECQYWHLNRLLTLIRVCNKKNSPPKKMSPGEMAAQRRKINDERRAKLATSG